MDDLCPFIVHKTVERGLLFSFISSSSFSLLEDDGKTWLSSRVNSTLELLLLTCFSHVVWVVSLLFVKEKKISALASSKLPRYVYSTCQF